MKCHLQPLPHQLRIDHTCRFPRLELSSKREHMTAAKADNSVSDALFQSIRDGTQPDPDTIASGELRADTLQTLAQRLQQARADVEVSCYLVVLGRC